MKAKSLIVLLGLLGTAGLASAAPPDSDQLDDFVVVFPAGVACESFDLQIAGSGGYRHMKEFKDEDDNVVRVLDAGTGSALVFTNLVNQRTVATKSNGAVLQQTFNADGSSTVTYTGHNVLILFPTDQPPGPSTTLIAGRLVFTVGLDGVFTVQETSGKVTDICAALAD